MTSRLHRAIKEDLDKALRAAGYLGGMGNEL